MAARIRTSTGVTKSALERGYRADHPTPWLGLLIWVLACAGLFVSLLMESEELKREPRLAAHGVQVHGPTVPHAFHFTGEIDKAAAGRWSFRCRVEQIASGCKVAQLSLARRACARSPHQESTTAATITIATTAAASEIAST